MLSIVVNGGSLGRLYSLFASGGLVLLYLGYV